MITESVWAWVASGKAGMPRGGRRPMLARMDIAIIADIHGNLPALEAVLADIERRGLRRIVNLGDCVSGPLWPRECLERLQAAGIPSLRGNHDRWVAEGGKGSSDVFARQRLDAAQIAWLGGLPAHLAPLPGVLAFHARPDDDNAYLLEEVAGGRLLASAPAAIAARLGPTEAMVLLCAHSHQPGLVSLPDGRAVLNPGSVGCPAYIDPTAPAHVSETGTPLACYAIADIAEGRLRQAATIRLAYDHARSAAAAEAQGFADWALALRTGLARPATE
jgi:predicted phosphodiesterase